MNILVLNLTRFGDLLQSQAAISDLAARGHRVGLVCLSNFAEAAELLRDVVYIAPLPGAAFLASLDATAETGRSAWHKALADLSVWRETLHAAFMPDVVCNLTPSLSARMLALFVGKGAPCTGFAVDEHGFSHNGSPWAAFLQGAGASREVSPFNIVDVFRRVACAADAPGVTLPGAALLRKPEAARLQAMRERLEARLPEEARGVVALQLGASEHRRRWPVAFFARLGNTLWEEERLVPVLLGSASEKELAARYTALAAHPVIDMCGATGLGDLAAALLCCRLLVTNDTGTMHYAAGLGVPVLAVFLATAQPFDTGPYQSGSCSVEPDLPCHPCAYGEDCPHELACRQAIKPECLAALALSHLRAGQWRMDGACSAARVWVAQADENGFMDLHSLSGHGSEARTLWLALQRYYLRLFLDRKRGAGFTPPALTLEYAFPQAFSAELRPVLEEAGAFIRLLAEQGKAALVRPLPMLRQRFMATWEKVHAALRRHAATRPLALLWAEETQAQGQEFPFVLAVAEDFYQLLQCIITQME